MAPKQNVGLRTNTLLMPDELPCRNGLEIRVPWTGRYGTDLLHLCRPGCPALLAEADVIDEEWLH
jgi:hypothetical protein